MDTIRHVCSLGQLCQASNMIKNNKLKLESYPFDWIFTSPDIIIHCLNDNFKTFLNRSLYVPHSNEPNMRKCGHSAYRNEMFNHHNPKDYDVDYNYFERCVKRFQQLLYSNNNKLFIVTFLFNHDLSTFEKNRKDVIEMNNTLKQYTTNFNIFVMFNILSSETEHTLITYENIDFCILYTKGKSDGVQFLDSEDNLYINNVLKNKYVFDVKPISMCIDNKNIC